MSDGDKQAHARGGGRAVESGGPALKRLDALLADAKNGRLNRDECHELVALSQFFPGRRRAIASVLGRQCSAAAVDALLMLPADLPGVVEGLYRALAHGVTRSFETPDHHAPQLIALVFRRSRARQFTTYLHRAMALGGAFEQLEHDGQLSFRIALRPQRAAARTLGDIAPQTPGFACPPDKLAHYAGEFQWLHRRLAKLRHSELWINGWSFTGTAPHRLSPAVQEHLVRAFFDSLQTSVHIH